MSYPPAVTHRIALVLAFSLFGFGCSTDDAQGAADSAADVAPDLCDVDAFSGSGNVCPRVSDRVCFVQCVTGGCKCTQGATGPVWKCTSDFSCVPDAGPLDDAATADGGTDGGADGGVDAATD